jgi:hypothetical protein
MIKRGIKMSTDILKEKFEITPSQIPNEGIMFKDLSKEQKSGHLGHGLVEYDKGCILAFYPNCSGDEGGHSGRGWMEYKRSTDGGDTWSKGEEFKYSKELYETSAHQKSAMVEKAVSPAKNVIVAFTLECDVSQNQLWEPYRVPKAVISYDGGITWDAGRELGTEAGRPYDAAVIDGKIYVLILCNDATEDFAFFNDTHRYLMMVSEDNGKTFKEHSTLPFGKGRAYGSLELLKDGSMIAYVYSRDDEEKYLDYAISGDGGLTWSEVKRTFMAKKIRNPQVVKYKGFYFLHGRSGQHGEGSGHFVLYTSEDGINWDEGTYLAMQTHGVGAYSNNLIVGKTYDPGNQKLLIMSSYAYQKDKTNIIYWWLK